VRPQDLSYASGVKLKGDSELCEAISLNRPAPDKV